MLQALDDPVGRTADAREAQRGGAGAGAHRHRNWRRSPRVRRGRAATAARLGQEIAAGFGLAALATVLAVAALG